MNNIIKYGSIEGIPLYNCSAHTPQEWSELDGIRRPVAGIIDMTYGILMNYANIPHGFNNILVVSVTCLLYVSFCFVLGKKFKQASNGNSSKSNKMSTQIFLQSAMICAINQIASIIYVIMNFIDVPFWLIIVGHSMWQFGHGAPALIYLCMNRTIRNGLLRKLGLKKQKVGSAINRDSNSAAFTKTN
ncbi:hypothetical protein CAEBREN_21447 [Caenorhabditis brenneri]|uniref:7TM GPCR serpentine receptor class x (Srx) domain-containing protein n=1 Tax=Caenorhabditis brenneri TaxID=135651 RepID=G0M8W3_CAEBE|nr:hypothetical protein CAEBREN_21447 [Caenorhabditis brenneri]